jgi:7-cyano-7-deazaguanine reductase
MTENSNDNTQVTDSPLGQVSIYKSNYDAGLLFPISRKDNRASLFKENLPFIGYDCWTAYEISWLEPTGKPRVVVAEIIFDCHSPNIIESKSIKLYLNSFNQTQFASQQEVVETMQHDLSSASGGQVDIKVYSADQVNDLPVNKMPGVCIDELELNTQSYHPDSELLKVDTSLRVENEILYSHLLKTNCPVTAQPDWATVFVEYSGHKIKEESLLAYIISYRDHQDFHEHCIENIFADIDSECQPTNLSVYGRYTRRGGLDINPLRTNYKKEDSQLFNQASLRTIRQ